MDQVNKMQFKGAPLEGVDAYGKAGKLVMFGEGAKIRLGFDQATGKPIALLDNADPNIKVLKHAWNAPTPKIPPVVEAGAKPSAKEVFYKPKNVVSVEDPATKGLTAAELVEASDKYTAYVDIEGGSLAVDKEGLLHIVPDKPFSIKELVKADVLVKDAVSNIDTGVKDKMMVGGVDKLVNDQLRNLPKGVRTEMLQNVSSKAADAAGGADLIAKEIEGKAKNLATKYSMVNNALKEMDSIDVIEGMDKDVVEELLTKQQSLLAAQMKYLEESLDKKLFEY